MSKYLKENNSNNNNSNNNNNNVYIAKDFIINKNALLIQLLVSATTAIDIKQE